MKRFLLAFTLLVSLSHAQTWTAVQSVYNSSLASFGGTCSISSLTCAMTHSPITPGNVMIVTSAEQCVAFPGQVTISSISGGGGGASFVIPTAGKCYNGVSGSHSANVAYLLSALSADTTTTVTRSGGAGCNWYISLRELTPPAGTTPSLDSIACQASPSGTTYPGATPSISGFLDAIVQDFSGGAGLLSASAPCSDFTHSDHDGSCSILNTTSGTPPTITTTQSASAEAVAIAITTSNPRAATPSCSPSTGSYSTSQSVSCSDSTPSSFMCYTTDGSTPTTDHTSACINGFLLSGSLTINITTTLNVVAGAVGFSDSLVSNNVLTLTSPFASVSPTSLSYGSFTVGSPSPIQNVTFTNIGGSGMLITSIAVTGDYSEADTCPNSVTPLLSGHTCTVSVTFTPTTTGARTGVLTFTDNSTGNTGTTQTVALSGTGATAPNPGITLNCTGKCSFIGQVTIHATGTQAPSGPPLTYAARTDAAVFGKGTCGGVSPCPGELLMSMCGGVPACNSNAFNPGAGTGHQGAAMSYVGGQSAVPPPACRVGNVGAACTSSGNNINGLSSYLSGINTQNNDPDFNTLIVRATDSTLGLGGVNQVNCLGGGNFGVSFHGVGAGTALVWSVADPTQPNQYKIRINNSGGGNSVIAFNPTTMTVTPSDLCGGYFPGAASFSGTDPHVIYTLNGGNQENTVLVSSFSGTLVTPEIMTQNGTGATAQLLAVNSNFVQLGPATGSPNGSNFWVGSTSGNRFTPNGSTPGTVSTSPYASTIYKGIICDGAVANPDESVCQKNPAGGTCLVNDTNPSCWYVYWTLLFNFNYLPSMVGDSHFPAANDCLPQNFVSIYTGVFAPSNDGTSFTQVFGDNGQNNNTGYNGGGNAATDKGYFCPGSPDNTCQGPIYASSFVVGKGCRVFNTMTDQLTGDPGTGPTGQVVDQQAFDIPGVLSTSPAPAPGDVWTQGTTGATTQLICTSAATAGSCSQLNGTAAYTGLIYGGNASSCTNSGADATHVWTDSNGGTLTPSGCPVNAPFLYPDVMHDMAQSPVAALATFSLVQTNNMMVVDAGSTPAISYNATTHLTTVLWGNNTVYSPNQQFNFANLVGSNVAYMNCTSANHCPVFTAVVVPNTGNTICPGNGPYCPSGANGTITISDNLGGPSNYTSSQTQTGCAKTCPTMYPHPQDETLANGGFGGTNFWQPQTLLVSADLRSTGHKAAGSEHIYQGKFYNAINEFTPWLPATVPDVSSPISTCNDPVSGYGSPCGSTYPGPLTPPPNGTNVSLIPFSITDDQHGDMECGYGSNDFCPPILSTALVCGQAQTGGVGSFACPPAYTSLWDDEIIAAENGATRSSAGNPVGLDCVYASTGEQVPCIYRFMHSYISGSHYALTVQNAEGSMSSDGLFYIFPSDWNLTLGCMDLTSTYCWSSWEATAPTATSNTSVTWSVDISGVVSISLSNYFCPTSGTQYWYVANPTPPAGNIQSIACGTKAGTVALSGFSSASWLNTSGPGSGGLFTLGNNTGGTWGCNTGASPLTPSTVGQCITFTGTNPVSPAHAGQSGTQTASGTKCSNGWICAVPTTCANGVPCQRSDVWIAKLQSAHQ